MTAAIHDFIVAIATDSSLTGTVLLLTRVILHLSEKVLCLWKNNFSKKVYYQARVDWNIQ